MNESRPTSKEKDEMYRVRVKESLGDILFGVKRKITSKLHQNLIFSPCLNLNE